MKYLLLFTFSPVQEFISQARKTQDLYAGSYILSHLCKTALKKAEKDYGAEVIYPKANAQSYPNRFIAILSAEEKELEKMGWDLQKTVEQEFLTIGRNILEQILINANNSNNSEDSQKLLKEFENQLCAYFQVYWVFKKLTESYKQAYNDIENLLGSIKNTRIFQQLPEQGRKCSLTGEHNALFYRRTEKGKKPSYIVPYALDISNAVPNKMLKKGEALGAVGLIKRFAEMYLKKDFHDFNTHFPSTAKVALLDALYKLKEIDEPTFEIALREDFEPQAIFDLDNQKMPDDLTGEQISNAEKVYKKLKENKIDFTSYYALIMFDADSMGAFLSGDKLKESVDLTNFHETLSEQLADYAKKAKQILEEPKGQVVYAGGDDFLGFINLHYLLEVLKELREKFDEIDLTEFTDEKLTFSAGVVIAHFKMPLLEVLKKAKEMEKAAKEIDADKDALGLAVLKRSGETVQAVYKWKCDDKLTTDLLEVINQKLNSEFSDAFIKNLNAVLSKSLDKKGSILTPGFNEQIERLGYVDEDLLLDSELRRLVARAYLGDKSEETKKRQRVEGLMNVLKPLYENKGSTANFLKLLSIIAFNKKKVKRSDN